MSDRMTPIPFAGLMNWALSEYRENGTVFGVSKLYRPALGAVPNTLFGESLALPFGPAAGPHTQLAQNIIAAYCAGSRFFELKTVQILDGEDLPVAKPCISAADECYNVEWSTELRVDDALAEYIKAWFALKLLSCELAQGADDGFIFNMSVGYDLAGIQSEKIDAFIEGLKDARSTAIFEECRAWALANLHRFEHVTAKDVDAVSPVVCRSITLSTLHGCPPAEIERIATYLLCEKGLNTFIKCNPTLLGYEATRKTLDALGYDYIVFDEHHFNEDLQFADAIPMLRRLGALAQDKGLAFGVKLTNTFPVDIAANELPGNEMYMSGRSLFLLSLQVAQKLSEAFDGALRISYSGGADNHNIAQLYQAGIWPITLATTLLKPGGYNRLAQMADALGALGAAPFAGVDSAMLAKLFAKAMRDPYYKKPLKPLPVRKSAGKVPLLDCFSAPCRGGCPIEQDIPAYLRLVKAERYDEALQVILERNPLPFITGTICAHPCMGKCTRVFYDSSVAIRAAKLKAAESAFDAVLPTLTVQRKADRCVAVVGGGPAGMAVAYFLAREGASVTIFEKRAALGGVVRHVIPAFRIDTKAIEKDEAFLKALGVNIVTNTEIRSLDQLSGYDNVVLAIGAWQPTAYAIDGIQVLDAVAFLEECKAKNFAMDLGENVAIIGGGNTAMDAARAAVRVTNVKTVRLVYRRDQRNMPADEEELALAIADGVELCELCAPIAWQSGILTCEKMRLGARDAAGRMRPEGTGIHFGIPADSIIAAVGETVDTALLNTFGIKSTEHGMPMVNTETMQAVLRPDIYVLGDARRGPATVVEAIADAARAAKQILHAKFDRYAALNNGDEAQARANKGVLGSKECLACSTVCENCVDVCPNRANVSVRVEGFSQAQILHIDGMCNECGNCETFCPYESRPYKDKFTLFWSEADLINSTNEGFALLEPDGFVCAVRLGGKMGTYTVTDAACGLPDGLRRLMLAAWREYPRFFI